MESKCQTGREGKALYSLALRNYYITGEKEQKINDAARMCF